MLNVDKVKVTKGLAQAIDVAINEFNGEGNLLSWHSEKIGSYTGSTRPLNVITMWELATMLVRGYEVELTPEEKALDYYSSLKGSEMESNKHLAYAIKHFLQLAEIEVKGVTDENEDISGLDYNDLF